jgi:hypothetical protein
MRSGKDALKPIGGLTGRQVLAPLLVVTLFVCHGLFGAMHQSGPVPTVIGEHPSHAHVTAEQQGSEAPHEDLGSVGYAAALFFVLVVAFWLLRGVAAWRRAPMFRSFEGRHRPAVLRYPRGPTVSSVQVFRL